ncbi:hypothetical protein K7X08_023992 [Anisodus acutangulus]|uniref:Uncharacterized protein n=1 Tax=Anisodus acutangulus TaxID=402998 RepID=A0A9Q1RF87_9SOLA|nr:hypothetical protein K7X08_023992 [Anisodus acutangulus]
MFSLNGSIFTNNSLSGVSRCLTQSDKRLSVPMVVVASVSSNGRPTDRNVSVLMDNTLKESSPSVIDKDSKSTVTGGVGDVYGEDSATEDQTITSLDLLCC